MTTREVAKQLGISHPQTVLRIEEQALEKIARRLRQVLTLDDAAFPEELDPIHRKLIKQPRHNSLWEDRLGDNRY